MKRIFSGGGNRVSLKWHRYPDSIAKYDKKRKGTQRAGSPVGQQEDSLWRPRLSWTAYGGRLWSLSFHLQWGRQGWACSLVHTSRGRGTKQRVALGLPGAGPCDSILAAGLCQGGSMDPAVPCDGELRFTTALVLRLPVFRFFFHLCLFMLFHLWYRLNLRPTTPPLSPPYSYSYLYLFW